MEHIDYDNIADFDEDALDCASIEALFDELLAADAASQGEE